jgi:hypothetical protein
LSGGLKTLASEAKVPPAVGRRNLNTPIQIHRDNFDNESIAPAEGGEL